MKLIKKKKFFPAPTYKQINAILNRGWKLVSVNSIPCLNGRIVSIGDSGKYSFLFERCVDNEEYYCLQYFIYYSLWSEEQYQQVMQEIEKYKEKGAYIISAYSIQVTDSDKNNVPIVFSSFPEAKTNLLYYVIIPREYVTEENKKCSHDAMLKCLGIINKRNTQYGIYFLIGAICFGFMALWKESGYIFWCLLIGFLIYLISFIVRMQDIYYFFRYRLYKKEYSQKYFLKTLRDKE